MFGDRRGPNGKGERTGRGLGYCNGSDTPGCMTDRNNSANFNYRCGMGLGRRFRANRNRNMGPGMGMGFRRGATEIRNWSLNESDNIDSLKRTKEFFEKRLEEINSELESFEK